MRAVMGVEKANPNAGRAIVHAFDCTHNPCRCEKVMPLREYFRTYYRINRETWPMTRRAAALDAARLTWRIRNHR